MRRLRVLLCALLLLLVGPIAAGAQDGVGPSLRGAQGTDAAGRATDASGALAPQTPPPRAGVGDVRLLDPPPAAPTPLLAGLLPPPAPVLMTPLPGSESQACRTGCAKGYYFCLAAGDASEDCSGSWGQCAAACNKAAPAA